MVQVEHSDGSTTQLLLFSRVKPKIVFQKFTGRHYDASWTFPPANEVKSLITMMSGEA